MGELGAAGAVGEEVFDGVGRRAVGDHLDFVLRAAFEFRMVVVGGKQRVDGDAGFFLHGDFHAAVALFGGEAEATGGGGRGEEFVELVAQGGDVDAVLRALRTGDGGDDGGEVEFELIGVNAVALVGDAEEALGLVVGFDGFAEFLGTAGAAEVADGFVIDGEEAHGRAVFGGHVGDGGAVGQAEGGGAGAVEFDEFADDAVFAEDFRDAEGEVSGGDAFCQSAVQIDADDFGDEESNRLAEHAGFCLDAAHAPADDAEAVDHGGVGVGADEGVRVVNAVFREHALGEILEVHLVDDADAGRHDGEGFEGLLAPFEELVALLVADELDGHVAVERGLRAGEIDLDGVVDDEIDRDERLDFFRGGAAGDGGVAHGGDIDEQRHAGEILEDDAGDGEGDFILAGGFGVVVGEVFDVGLGDFAAVHAAEDGFEHDADRDRQFREIGEALFGEGGERVEVSLGARAGGEGAECVHEWIVVEKPVAAGMRRRLWATGDLSKSFSRRVKVDFRG